ncbi:MAG: pitrilysin family protein [candidate division WOR-3 bacterium]
MTGAIFMMIAATELPEVLPVRFKTKTLDNGLMVIVVEDHSAPVVAVQVWYKVGSRNESYRETGLAHLTEHMMFKGSAGVHGNYSEIIDQLGGSDNAFTDRDVTVYHCVVPADALDVPLMMEADRMVNLVFNEFLAERDVVMEERRWRTDNSPFGTAWENLWATAYMVHPYRHPVIGWGSVIASITLDDTRRFYETFYRPDNAILVIAGDVRAEDAFEMAKKHFGKIPRPLVPVPPVTAKEPPQKGERRTVVHKEGFMSIYLSAYHIPEATHPDIPALDVLATLLGGGKSSRLYREIVRDQELATSVWAYTDESVDPGLLVVGAVLQQGKDPKDVEKIIDKEIIRIKEGGVSEEELRKAARQAIAENIYEQESAAGTAFSIGNAAAIQGDPDYINRYPERVAAVTAEEIMNVARKYLTQENRSVVVLLPKAPEDIGEYIKMMEEGQKKEFKY